MRRIVYLCADLLFTSKIRETARALGLEATAARDPQGLCEAAAEAALAIVDLRRPDGLVAVARLRAEASTLPVYGFCDHERVDLFHEARRLGATPLAKGKLSSDLGRILAAATSDQKGDQTEEASAASNRDEATR